jgi:hypothetical protein
MSTYEEEKIEDDEKRKREAEEADEKIRQEDLARDLHRNDD